MRSLLLPLLLLSSSSAAAAAAAHATTLELPAGSHAHAWANRSEQLAVLLTRPDGRQRFLLVRADTGETRRLEVPAGVRIGAFCWDADDRRLVVAIAGREPSSDDLRVLTVANGRLRPYPGSLESLYAAIDQLAHAPASTLWAAVFSGEGHPDVAVYDGTHQVLATDVYPGAISIVGWHGEVLFVASDIDLRKGLTREARGTLEAPEEPADEPSAYAIDVRTRQVRLATAAEAQGLGDRSFDDRFEVRVEVLGRGGRTRARLVVRPVPAAETGPSAPP
jgi:hypothetical protein